VLVIAAWAIEIRSRAGIAAQRSIAVSASEDCRRAGMDALSEPRHPLPWACPPDSAALNGRTVARACRDGARVEQVIEDAWRRAPSETSRCSIPNSASVADMMARPPEMIVARPRAVPAVRACRLRRLDEQGAELVERFAEIPVRTDPIPAGWPRATWRCPGAHGVLPAGAAVGVHDALQSFAAASSAPLEAGFLETALGKNLRL